MNTIDSRDPGLELDPNQIQFRSESGEMLPLSNAWQIDFETGELPLISNDSVDRQAREYLREAAKRNPEAIRELQGKTAVDVIATVQEILENQAS